MNIFGLTEGPSYIKNSNLYTSESLTYSIRFYDPRSVLSECVMWFTSRLVFKTCIFLTFWMGIYLFANKGRWTYSWPSPIFATVTQFSPHRYKWTLTYCITISFAVLQLIPISLIVREICCESYIRSVIDNLCFIFSTQF